MDLPDSVLLSPAPLAVICATLTLLTAHLISPSTRSVTAAWALGALIFWLAGASLWAWSTGTASSSLSWPVLPGVIQLSPAGGLIAVLAWTLWYCRRRPVSRRRWCLLIMIASGLWWGVEQWRTTLVPALPDTLPALTLESLEGHSVTLADDVSKGYLLLWRSDCGLCRQWLQQLAERPTRAQTNLTLINQGEPLLGVIRYLDQYPDQRLTLKETSLLLDPRQHLLALTGQYHLPVLLHVAPDNTLTRVDDPSVIMAAMPQKQ